MLSPFFRALENWRDGAFRIRVGFGFHDYNGKYVDAVLQPAYERLKTSLSLDARFTSVPSHRQIVQKQGNGIRVERGDESIYYTPKLVNTSRDYDISFEAHERKTDVDSFKPGVSYEEHVISYKVDGITVELVTSLAFGRNRYSVRMDVGAEGSGQMEELCNVLWCVLHNSKLSYTNDVKNTLIHDTNIYINGKNARNVDKSILIRPRNLKWDDLVYGGLVGNSKTHYAVTHKADGVRRVLIFHKSGVWLVDPPVDYCLLMALPAEKEGAFEGYVFDGEYIEHLSMFVAFDILATPERRYEVRYLTYVERHAIVTQFMTINGNVLPNFTLMSMSMMEFTTPDDFYACVRDFLAQQSDLPFPQDGLIFVPARLGYEMEQVGDLCAMYKRILTRIPDVVKWKPNLTIDFAVERDAKGNVQLMVYDPAGLKLVPFRGDSEMMFDPKRMLDLDSIRAVPTGAVAEFAWRHDQLTSLGIRGDKTSANRTDVATEIWSYLHLPILAADITGESGRVVFSQQQTEESADGCEAPTIKVTFDIKDVPCATKGEVMSEAVLLDITQTITTSGNVITTLEGATGTGKSTRVPGFVVTQGRRALIKSRGPNYKPKYIPYRAIVAVPTIVLAKGLARQAARLYPEIRVGYAAEGVVEYTSDTELVYATYGHVRRLYAQKLKNIATDPHGMLAFPLIFLDEVHIGSVDVSLVVRMWETYVELAMASPEKMRVPRLILMTATAIGVFAQGTSKRGSLLLHPDQLVANNYVVHCPSPYPVEIFYTETPIHLSKLTMEIVAKVMDIHRSFPYRQDEPGHILVFVSGRTQVTNVVGALESKGINANVKALFSGSESEKGGNAMSLVPGMRNIIVATNVAESGVTIPGAGFVVDGMRERRPGKNRAGGPTLEEVYTSQNSARQRAGRVGRTGPGKVYRMITRDEFFRLEPFRPLDIESVPIHNEILEIVAMGQNPLHFLRAMVPEAEVRGTLEELIRLELVRYTRIGGYRVTLRGDFSARFPLGVRAIAFLHKWLNSRDLEGIPYPALPGIIIGALIDDDYGHLFHRPTRQPKETEMAYRLRVETHAKTAFASYAGASHLETLLNVWNLLQKLENKQGYSLIDVEGNPKREPMPSAPLKRWCKKYSLVYSTITKLAQTIRTCIRVTISHGYQVEIGDFRALPPPVLIKAAHPILLEVYRPSLMTIHDPERGAYRLDSIDYITDPHDRSLAATSDYFVVENLSAIPTKTKMAPSVVLALVTTEIVISYAGAGKSKTNGYVFRQIKLALPVSEDDMLTSERRRLAEEVRIFRLALAQSRVNVGGNLLSRNLFTGSLAPTVLQHPVAASERPSLDQGEIYIPGSRISTKALLASDLPEANLISNPTALPDTELPIVIESRPHVTPLKPLKMINSSGTKSQARSSTPKKNKSKVKVEPKQKYDWDGPIEDM